MDPEGVYSSDDSLGLRSESILDDNAGGHEVSLPEISEGVREGTNKSDEEVSWNLSETSEREAEESAEEKSTETSSYDVEIKSDDSIFDEIYRLNSDKQRQFAAEPHQGRDSLSTTEQIDYRTTGTNGVIANPTPSEILERSWGFGEPFYVYMNKLYAMADAGLSGVKSELTEASNEDEVLSSESERDYIRGTEEEESSTGWAALARLPDPWAEARHPTPPLFPNLELMNGETSDDLQYMTIAGGLGNLALPPGCSQHACTKLQLNSLGLKTIGILANYKYLQYIDLSGNNIQDMSSLWEIPHLVVLDVSGNEVDDAGVGQPEGSVFLTYLNLSSNRLRDIPDFSGLWALKHLDLADNKIRSIQNLDELEYLQYLNLSRNSIKQVKNLTNPYLKEIDLSRNNIKTWSKEVTKNLIRLQIINISHNKLTTLEPLKGLSTLRNLDISNNNISNIIEFENIKCLDSLKELKLVDNNINTIIPDRRKLIIFNNPNIKILNCIPVHYRERANAVHTFSSSTDVMTKDVSTFYRKLCTSPFHNPKRVKPIGFHPAIVIIVSFVGCYQPEILFEAQNREPWKVKIVKQITTQPRTLDQNTGKPDLSSTMYKFVSAKKFYQMDTEGYFIKTFANLGYKYGIPISELDCPNQVVLTVMNFTAAMKLVWEGYNPILLLMFPENTDLLKDFILDWFDKTRTSRANEYRRQSRLVLQQVFKRPPSGNSMGQRESSKDLNCNLGTKNMERFSSHKLLRRNMQPLSRKLRYGRDTRDFSINSLRKLFGRHKRKRSKRRGSIKFMHEPHIPLHFSKMTEETQFVDYIIRSRDAVLKEHTHNPGLFRLYIPTDDMDHATNKLREIIDEAFEKLQHSLKTSHTQVQFVDNPLFDEMVRTDIKEYVKEILTNRFPSDLIH